MGDRWNFYSGDIEKKVVPILTSESKDALLPRKAGEAKMWCCGAGPAKMERTGYYHNMDPDNFIDREGTANTVVLDNRMTLREGVQAIGVQRLGQAAEAMACALCNAVPQSPGKEVVLHLLEGLPDEWDAEFELPGGNGYWVMAKKVHGRIESLELESHRNSSLLIRNPWGEAPVIIDYGDKKETVIGKKFRVLGNCRIYQKKGMQS